MIVFLAIRQSVRPKMVDFDEVQWFASFKAGSVKLGINTRALVVYKK